jgi:hypothetical protein
MLGACYACQPLLAPCMHSTRCASHHDTQWTCSQPLTWQTLLRCHDQRSTRQNTLQFQATAPTSCLCSTLPARRGPSNCSISADSPLPPLSCAASLHTKEVFVTEPEWFVVLGSRLPFPYARSPSHSQSQVRELGKLFLPPPLTDSHIFFSAISHRQLHISEDPVPLCFAVKIPQFIPHGLARRPHFLPVQKNSPAPTSRIDGLSSSPALEHTKSNAPNFRVPPKEIAQEIAKSHHRPPPWRASAKPTGCPTTRPSLACCTPSSARNVSRM